MQETLLQQGIELMVFGMGTVFVFLVVLIGVTNAMSAIVQRFFPEIPPSLEPDRAVANAAADPQQDEQLIAVISAAVHKYRSRHK